MTDGTPLLEFEENVNFDFGFQNGQVVMRNIRIGKRNIIKKIGTVYYAKLSDMVYSKLGGINLLSKGFETVKEVKAKTGESGVLLEYI